MSGNKGNRDLDVDIFNRFSRIAMKKFTSSTDNADDKLKQLDALYKRPEFHAEKQILNDMNGMGLGKGVLAGLGCFAFLRWSPQAVARILRRRAGMGTASTPPNPFHQSPGYKLDPIASTGQANARSPGLLFRVFRLTLDTFCSVSIGAYASLYFVDKDKMMKQLADIPLVEGRSLVSEELCGDFTREFRKFDRGTWDAHHPSLNGASSAFSHNEGDGKTDIAATIQGFVANCRRRAIYEDDARRERGAGHPDDAVVVPAPGVPRDIPVGLDELLEETALGGEEADASMAAGEEYFDTSFGTDNDARD